MARDTGADGWKNQLETYLLTHFGPVWRALQGHPGTEARVNRALINRAILKTATRPYALSTRSDYTSWASLTDRTFSARHLPPADRAYVESLPPLDEVTELFRRTGPTQECEKSTVLFAYFAQWFTDGFLRTDRTDPRKNTSNHDIDLSPLYGITPAMTERVRSHEGGKLKSQVLPGPDGPEEYPPFLCQNGEIKPEFRGLVQVIDPAIPAARRDEFFAMGGDRANAHIGYLMLNTLFLREHNRLASLIAADHPSWDDERLFSTARNTLIVILIKIVIEDYINHITPYHFKFRAAPWDFKDASWYRPNWMAVEFNLLYRWHGLIPSELVLPDPASGEQRRHQLVDTMWTTRPITDCGLGRMFAAAASQPAGRIGVGNTDPALLEAEKASLNIGRLVRLRPYNEYRQACSMPPVTRFEQITGDTVVQARLRELYGTPDRVEYFAGIFAEDTRPNSVLPALLGRLVGIDAFSQALTNPLLAPAVFNEDTFSRAGMREIRQTRSLSDVLRRNVPPSGGSHLATLTRLDWKRKPS